ncbi:MAG: hypothetical protein V1674_02095 [Candidatus Omnitrophota bacterium]
MNAFYKIPHNKFKGLLLFEVAVAVAIVSAGVIFVLRSFNTTLGAMDFSSKYYQAMLLLEQKAWDLKALAISGGNLKEVSPKEGDFKEPYQNFHWSLQLEEIPDSRLEQLDLSVAWFKKKNRNYFEVNTYTYTESSE